MTTAPLTAEPVEPARHRIHKAFCGTQFECAYEESCQPGNNSVWCRVLDALIDEMREELLHVKARALHDEWAGMPRRAQNTLGPGIMWVIDELNPYVWVKAFDPELDEVHPREENPSCPGCALGEKHLHRKDNGAFVPALKEKENTA